jgi:DNA-binding transcriptional LysR family regulator
MMSRHSLDDLAAFAIVARAGSFTRAAAELRVSTSALSHTIKGLEARLGIRLLQRNSRSVSVTAAGDRLLQTLDPALAEIGGALDQLGVERDLGSGTARPTATLHAFETVIRAYFGAVVPSAPVEWRGKRRWHLPPGTRFTILVPGCDGRGTPVGSLVPSAI